MTKPRKMTLGMRFGRLVVNAIAKPKSGTQCTLWQVTCDCGTTKTVRSLDVWSGDTKSCGCLSRETSAARRKENPARKRTRFDRSVPCVPIFSEEDADLLNHNWWWNRDGYPTRCLNYGNRPAHHDVLLRVCGHKPDYQNLREVTDHINRQKHDNRRENLRITTCKQNSLNHGKIVRGRKKCAATIMIGSKRHYIGSFATPPEARAARLQYAKEHGLKLRGPF